MRDIIKHVPSFTAVVDRLTLDKLKELIIGEYFSVEGALTQVGIDPRYYGHWVNLAKLGDDNARSLVLYLDSLDESRIAKLRKDVSMSRDGKAKMLLVEELKIEREKRPSLDVVQSTDDRLFISDDWE